MQIIEFLFYTLIILIVISYFLEPITKQKEVYLGKSLYINTIAINAENWNLNINKTIIGKGFLEERYYEIFERGDEPTK